MKSEGKSKFIKYITIFFGAYLNAVAMQYLWSVSGDTGTYTGMQIYSFMPESLVWFGLCAFLLHRFLEKETYKETGKLILSLFFGFFLGFFAIFAQELYFNTTLFNSGVRLFRAILCTIGLMIFTVPLVCEITEFFDHASQRIAKTRATAGGKPIKPVLYWLIIWALNFASYVPMLLFTWPINLFGDASDALGIDYLMGRRSTHHTPIHWLLMGWAYDWGLKHGDPGKGMLIFTLAQMLILSGSVAFLSFYLYKKKTAPALRRVVLLVSLLNPVNSYFAVTAEKGTIGIALSLVGSVLLAMILDDLKKDGGKPIPFIDITPASIGKMVLFAMIMSIGCLFRNNMIYAIVVGGIIISLLTKGLRKKATVLVMILVTFVIYKGEFNGIEKWQGLTTNDKYTESFGLPIMCLSRIAILHGSELPENMYLAITEYIPEYALSEYNISIADSIKENINVKLMEAEPGRFLKLFIKGFCMYPGDCIDQFGWLTVGYFNPAYAHVLGGTSPVFYGGLRSEEFTDIEVTDRLPVAGQFLNWVYRVDGRYMIPGFAWFFRPTVYVWLCIYAFFYGIYRKSPRKVSLFVIPLMYFGTILLGPLCTFRYVYLNVLFLGYTVYTVLEPEKED